MNPVVSDILMHYGVSKVDGAPVGSGRYPLGSGENPNQRRGDFLSRVKELRDSGFTYTDENGKTWTGDTAIAKSMGLSTTQFRTQYKLAKDEERAALVATAKDLREKGYSLSAIADKMGYANDSSVRSLLNEHSEGRMNQAKNSAEILKKVVAEKGMIDVGTGVELEMGISSEKLKEALYILQLEGYEVYSGRTEQVTNPGKMTTLKVLCPPGTEHKEIFEPGDVSSFSDYTSHDDGETFDPTWVYPKSMDSNRLQIRYAEEGGKDKDGVVEIRRGVDDLSLGDSHYAQVRILVDDTHYIKGMAVYSDNMPDGVDVIFNTNKSSSTAKMDVLKTIKEDDPTNPFGSLIKPGINDPDNPTEKNGGQSYYYDKNGNKQLSLINKRSDEGDWGDWKDKLPSQFLSKQSQQLIDKQLGLSIADKKAEYDDICSLTNPTVKKQLLESFADDCDSAAVHLKAASLPGQKYKVILPLTSVKDNEVYAPGYENGETVALIRYPHGGTFEIPILKVNNKLQEGQEVLGTTPQDAIGINAKVAARLSGADFDGDTVTVIPCNTAGKVKITSTTELAGLKDFDPKLDYGHDEVKVDADGTKHYYRAGKEFKAMTNTQTEMGKISNLITDMTLKGATDEQLARAVRHSMVVIDAEKHGLDYKQSEKDNDIRNLKQLYQKHTDDDGYGGASTLISRAKSETSIDKQQGTPKTNIKGESWYDPSKPEGSLIYKTSDNLTYDVAKVSKRSDEAANATVHISKKGTRYVQFDDSDTWVPVTGKATLEEGSRVTATLQTKTKTQKSTQMADTDDAYTLVSEFDTPAERSYANYANEMKSLANQARLEIANTGKITYSASAAATYATEVAHLKAQLQVAKKNAPRERQAQLLAKSRATAIEQDNPDLTKAEITKIRQQQLTSARNEVGAKRTSIEISDREWEAIQAGAITESVLKDILKNTNVDTIKERATPRTKTQLSASKVNKIKAMKASGYTTEQIANAVGCSTSTVLKYLK